MFLTKYLADNDIYRIFATLKAYINNNLKVTS